MRLHNGRTRRMRIDSQDRKRIDGQRSGTALAFSAVAPWERPGLAAHLILSHPQRLALWSVPTIVTSCRHCGLQATHGQSRPLRRQHFDPCKRSIERAYQSRTRNAFFSSCSNCRKVASMSATRSLSLLATRGRSPAVSTRRLAISRSYLATVPSAAIVLKT